MTDDLARMRSPLDSPPVSMQNTYCTKCGSELLSHDRYCGGCGADVDEQASVRATYVSTWLGSRGPAPGATTDGPPIEAIAIEQPKSQRRSWYRRPLIVVPLLLMLAATSVLGYGAWQAWDTLRAVQSVSTPPAMISAEQIGIEGSEVVIDTAPAQEAIQAREEARARGEEPMGVAAGGGGGGLFTFLQSATEEADDDADESPLLTAPTEVADPEESAATPVATPEATPADAAVDQVVSTGTNILLMGVDARAGESIDIGVRPDTLAVLNLNEEAGTCRMLQIPRDSRVHVPGYGMSKINHALAVGGIPFERLVVEDYLGITIHHYALVDFTGLTEIVDTFGGVTIDNPTAFTIDSHHFPEGEIHLNGEEALMFLRFRGTPEGDFGRVLNQQLVLRALLDKANTMNVISLIPDSFSLLQDHFRTDLGVRDLIDLANTYNGVCTGESIRATTLPGEVATMYDDMMQMDLSFVVSTEEDVMRHAAWLIYGEAPPREQPLDLGTPEATPEASPDALPFSTPEDMPDSAEITGQDQGGA